MVHGVFVAAMAFSPQLHFAPHDGMRVQMRASWHPPGGFHEADEDAAMQLRAAAAARAGIEGYMPSMEAVRAAAASGSRSDGPLVDVHTAGARPTIEHMEQRDRDDETIAADEMEEDDEALADDMLIARLKIVLAAPLRVVERSARRWRK